MEISIKTIVPIISPSRQRFLVGCKGCLLLSVTDRKGQSGEAAAIQPCVSEASRVKIPGINDRPLEARVHLYDSHGITSLISATYKKSSIDIKRLYINIQ